MRFEEDYYAIWCSGFNRFGKIIFGIFWYNFGLLLERKKIIEFNKVKNTH